MPTSISIDDVTVTEGDTGTVDAVFTVTLSEPSVDTVTVEFATADDTATAGSDYVTASGTLEFSAGAVTRTITVQVNGDLDPEADETFFVNLTNAVGATITDGQGEGTILDNDAAETVVFSDSFEAGEWSGLWVEDSQNDWFRSPQRATAGSYSAEVDGSATDATLTMATPLDLTPYGTATLTFDWYIESGLDAGEYLALDLFDGTTWNEMATLSGNVDPENTWHHETIPIGGQYLVDDFQLRFRAKMNKSDEDADVDNVQIVASGTSSASAMATDMALLAWIDSASSDDEETDLLTTQAADELALMLVE